jgi:hypothetical protein
MSDGFPDIPPGGCVNWTAFDVPTIWAMLAYEDGTLSVEQANAWNRTYDLLASHAKNLQALRDGLAERWPPERSEASAVFLEYLDELIGAVNPTSYASSSNAVVLSDLIDTLAAAKGELAPLHQQWQAGTGDPKLQAELNARAAKIMASTDVAVYQHGQRFVVPPEYEPPLGTVESTSPFSAGDTTVRPLRTMPTEGQPTALPSAARFAPGSPDSRDGGPALSWTANQPTPIGGPAEREPSPPVFADTPAGRVLSPGGVIGNLGGRPISSTPEADVIGDPRSNGGLKAPLGSRESAAINSQATEAEPTRNAHLNKSTQPGPKAAESRESWGGVGGMLGGGRAATRRNWTEGGDRYVDWPVSRGVVPVLLPPPDPQTHDPGPGVIGIDR